MKIAVSVRHLWATNDPLARTVPQDSFGNPNQTFELGPVSLAGTASTPSILQSCNPAILQFNWGT
jgi:hypothetical protein